VFFVRLSFRSAQTTCLPGLRARPQSAFLARMPPFSLPYTLVGHATSLSADGLPGVRSRLQQFIIFASLLPSVANCTSRIFLVFFFSSIRIEFFALGPPALPIFFSAHASLFDEQDVFLHGFLFSFPAIAALLPPPPPGGKCECGKSLFGFSGIFSLVLS